MRSRSLWNRSELKIIALFSLGYFAYYLCRYNYPIALPFIQDELQATTVEIGLIATALTGGYAFGQLINGFLVDRHGARLLFTIGGLGSMVSNLAMGGGMALEFFIIAWLANGYFQAMGYPSTLKLIANWFKREEQGKPLGVSECMQSVAAIAILPIAGWLALTISWRLVFIVPAIILGAMSIVFWTQARDSPTGKKVDGVRALPAYRQALGSWRLDLAYISYGCTQFVRYAMITWIPMFLFLETGLDIFQAAVLAISFQVGGVLGSLLIGWAADTQTFRYRRWSLITIGMLVSGSVGASVGLFAAAPIIVVALLFVCGAGIEALEVAYFLTPADYLGSELTATGVGCMNAVGKGMATLQGISLGWIIAVFGYGSAFAVAGAFGIAAALLIIPSRRKT